MSFISWTVRYIDKWNVLSIRWCRELDGRVYDFHPEGGIARAYRQASSEAVVDIEMRCLEVNDSIIFGLEDFKGGRQDAFRTEE